MKRFLWMVCLSLAATASAQLKLGLHIGATHTNGYYPETAFFKNDPICAARNGLMGGATLQLPVGKKWTYETGVFYMGKSLRLQSPPIPVSNYKRWELMHYVVLNQNWLRQVWRKGHFSAGLGSGLYLATALNGAYKLQYRSFNLAVEEEGSLDIGSDKKASNRRWDWGGNLLLRVQYRQWQLTGQFNAAFTAYDRDNGSRLRGYGLSLGYVL
jgi:hypothetical protein